MATTCAEKIESRTLTTDAAGDVATAEFIYLVRGTASETTAKASVAATAADTYGDLIRLSIALEPVHIDSNTPQSCIWEATVQYGQREEPESGDPPNFSFDTTGGTQHITQSKATISRTAASGTAPDFQGAVGVTSSGVEGVDVTVPVYAFSETHYLPAATVTDAYKGKLFNLTGKTNSASFRGLAAGECLFLGASGSMRDAETWEITFKFAGSPNKTSITVGPITVPAKKGWEYLWVKYSEQEDATSKTLVQRPIAAYVEKVYDAGDFADLGIG